MLSTDHGALYSVFNSSTHTISLATFNFTSKWFANEDSHPSSITYSNKSHPGAKPRGRAEIF